MKNIYLKILILLIFIVQSTLICDAQVITKKNIVPFVEKSIKENLENSGYKNVTVTVVNVPFIQLTIPDGKLTYRITSNSKGVNSRSFMLVSMYVNGEFIRTVGIPVKISALKDVYVAKETIGRGACLTSSVLQVKTIDVTNTFVTPLEAGELNKQYVTTKVFMAGNIIDKKYLKSQPDVVKNAAVTLYFKSKDDLSISIDGTAVSEGNVGDVIAVRNKKYNRIYNGKIVGENKVLIRI